MNKRTFTQVFENEADQAMKETGRIRHILDRSYGLRVELQDYPVPLQIEMTKLLSVEELLRVTFISTTKPVKASAGATLVRGYVPLGDWGV